MSVCLSIMSSCRPITISHHACLTFNIFDIIFQLLLLLAFLLRGLKMSSKEIQDVSDSEGKGENYQRTLTLLNEAVDILKSPCTSRDHPQQLPAHQYVGSVQVPATSERGELQEIARLYFPFYSQGASAGKVSSRQPFKRFRPSASSNGPQKSFKPKETWTHTFICLTFRSVRTTVPFISFKNRVCALR